MSALGGLWRSVWRFHRLLAGILVLEYALAFMILLTAMGVLASRATAIREDSGVIESGLYVLQGQGIGQPTHLSEMFGARDRFATLVGAEHVAMGSSAPFLGRYSRSVSLDVPDDLPRAAPMQVQSYEGDAHLAVVMGLHLLHGRWFRPDEVVHRHADDTHLVILSESLARRLFHGGKAVGRQIGIAGGMHTVIGVVNPLAAPHYLGSGHTLDTLLLPKVASSCNVLLIRYGGPAADLRPILAALRGHDKGKVSWSLSPFGAVRARYFRSDRLTVAALAAVVFAVLLTALCGILGLTHYWVAKRRPQIAIRRALGARKRDIDLHFLAEGGMLVTMGLLLGTVLKLCLDGLFTNLRTEDGLVMWTSSVALILVLAMLVIHASLRRWQRMSPVELMRRY
jgi:putative ABC transport system permease protein